LIKDSIAGGDLWTDCCGLLQRMASGATPFQQEFSF